MKRVIITGATGAVGTALIKACIEKQIEVLVFVRADSKRNSNIPKHPFVKTINCSLEELAEVENPEETCYDVFYHLAWAGVNGPAKADPLIQLNNAKMAMNCATLAKKLGVKKLLCAGTIAERAVESLGALKTTSGGMMYGVAKHATHLMLETYCKNINLDFVWMQFSNIYGPQNKTGNLVSYTIGELQKGKEASFGPALLPYDFIFVDDLLEAAVRLGDMETKENCYFIGSGKPRILKEYLLEIGHICGKEDLIKIGLRPDDGIIYTFDMFDTSLLIKDIGNYISKDFSEGIKYTLENY